MIAGEPGGDDHGAGEFTAVVVRVADQRDVGDARMAVKLIFDVAHRDHGHAADPVGGAAVHSDPAAAVRDDQVAGVVPAVVVLGDDG